MLGTLCDLGICAVKRLCDGLRSDNVRYGNHLFGLILGNGRLVQRVVAAAQDSIDVVYFAQRLQERNQVDEFRVGHIVEP